MRNAHNAIYSAEKFVIPCHPVQREELVSNGLDIDFILYSGTAEQLFGDGDDPFLSGLTGNFIIIRVR